jgi:serine/threonine-protein kinase
MPVLRDKAQLASSDAPAAGALLAGRYRVEGLLGTGGMGVVVAATQVPLGRRVAIKLLSREAASDAEAVERFFREAQSAAALRSEHVVKILDFGSFDDGAPYMVMEYLDGQDLARTLDGVGQLGVEPAVDFVLQACEPLAEAHAVGIVHRDLKPANLFVTRAADGSPLLKILDFGISKVLPKESVSITTTGSSMGSPVYMSPEQIRDAKAVDPRSDVWALGIVLYELLAGEPPFVAERSHEVLARIVQDAPRPLGTLRPNLPPGLEDVVHRCLQKNPEDRFQNVGELARALQPFATAAAAAFADRTERVLRSGPNAITSPDVLTPLSSQPLPPIAVTAGAWHGAAHKRSAMGPVAVIVAFSAVAAIVGVYLLASAVRREPAPVQAAAPPSVETQLPAPVASAEEDQATPAASGAPGAAGSSAPAVSAKSAPARPRPAPAVKRDPKATDPIFKKRQ